MPSLQIRVGAALDTNLTVVFKPFIQAAKDARVQVAREMQAIDKELEKGYRNAPSYAKKGFKGAVDAATSADNDITRSAERSAQAQSKAREQLFRSRMRYLQEEARAEEEAFRKRERAYSAFVQASARNFGGLVRAGGGVLGSIVRGAGVNFDISTNVAAGMQAERSAALLSNKSFLEGAEGKAGQRQDPAALMTEAGSAADATAHSTNEMLDAMTSFVERSGDLEVARKMITEIGKTSNATGANLSKLGEVAGALDLKLQDSFGDAEKRATIVSSVIRAFAAQGKKGAIDIEQLTPHIPKLIAAAGRFGGSEEDAFKNAGILAQISAKGGGSGTAAMAAQAVVALARDLGKESGVKQFLRGGMKESDIFTDKSRTAIRNPIEIIMAAVAKANGDIMKVSAIFKNAATSRSAEGFANIYRRAAGESRARGEDGRAAGVAAMQKLYDSFRQAAMSKDEVDRENAAIMKTNAAKAQVFQNQLERIASSMANKVLPQLEELAPKALAVADAFGKIISFAAENPGTAITAGIVASIARAGVGEAASSALSWAVKAAAKSEIGGKISEAIGSVLKNAVSGTGIAGMLGPAALALTIGSAVLMIESAVINEKLEEGVQRSKEQDAAINYHLKKADGGQGDRAELEADLAAVKARIDAANSHNGSTIGRAWEVITGKKSVADQGQEKFDQKQMGNLQGELKGIAFALENLKPKPVQDVRVTNPPALAPSVDGDGRTGPGGRR